MIKRAFWLVLGATLGVVGYRKAVRLAQTITGGPSAQPAVHFPSAARAVPPPAQASAISGRPARAAITSGERIRATVRFVRDVRDGMADYRDLQRGQIGRSLDNQGDRAQQGAGRHRGTHQP
jgi:hypothetical protein